MWVCRVPVGGNGEIAGGFGPLFFLTKDYPMRRVISLLLMVSIVFSNLLYVQPAHAVIPGVAWLLGAAGVSVNMARAIEWSIAIHGAIISGFYITQAVTGADGGQQPSSSGGVQVKLNPNATQANPNEPGNEIWELAPNGRYQPKQQLPPARMVRLSNFYNNTVRIQTELKTIVTTDSDIFTVVCKSFGFDGRWAYRYPSDQELPYCIGSGTISGFSVSSAEIEFTTATRCPLGYSMDSASTSNLCYPLELTKIKKPATMACEITSGPDGLIYPDGFNQNCTGLTDLDSSSNVKYEIPTSDGSYSIQSTPTGYDLTVNEGGQTRVISVSDDPNSDNQRIDSITDGSGGTVGGGSSTTGGDTTGGTTGGTTGDGTTGGTTDGGTTGGGTTGDGSGTTGDGAGGECGGWFEPACKVDVIDDGFNGQGIDTTTPGNAIDANDSSLLDTINGLTFDNKHGVTWPWQRQFERASCDSISYGFQDRSMDIDICKTLDVIRQGLGWFLYIWLTIYLFELFTANVGGNGRRQSA